MKRTGGIIAALVVLFGVTACSEPDQSMSPTASRDDSQPWKGAKNGFVTPGYEPGDKLRWEAQMRRRAQDQNEYVKSN